MILLKIHKGTLSQVKKQDLIIQKSFYYYYIPNKVLDFAATLTKKSKRWKWRNFPILANEPRPDKISSKCIFVHSYAASAIRASATLKVYKRKLL